MLHSALPLAALAALLFVTAASPSRCILRPNPGPCEALIKRYYWDSISGECKSFNWGGCQGVVPFNTLADCEKSKCDAKRCLFPGITGPCKAAFPKYFYNPIQKKCEKFIWGGCRGLVPFNTLADCEVKCEADTPPEDPCEQKPERGPCRARIARYFFDGRTQSCKRFFWGGCRGVVPFVALKDCLAKCPVVDSCALAPKSGPCRGAFRRYFFDRKSKSCKQFIWGGCKGVVPFKTLAQCEKKCEM